jgi:hypothetical protein
MGLGPMGIDPISDAASLLFHICAKRLVPAEWRQEEGINHLHSGKKKGIVWMNEQIELSKILPIVAPVLCAKAENTRGPKWMWVLIILFANIIGSVAFFIAGRRSE